MKIYRLTVDDERLWLAPGLFTSYSTFCKKCSKNSGWLPPTAECEELHYSKSLLSENHSPPFGMDGRPRFHYGERFFFDPLFFKKMSYGGENMARHILNILSHPMSNVAMWERGVDKFCRKLDEHQWVVPATMPDDPRVERVKDPLLLLC